MTTDRPVEYLVSLVRELCKLPHETEWVEFKENNPNPQEIGEYISALANSAALEGKAFAYLVWGVRDGDHAVVGSTFAPRAAKVGNEELENWLLRALTPKIHFRFFEVTVDGLAVVLLEIERAFRQRPLTKMDKADRIRAVYLHACLRYVNREHMTNTSLRARFGIEAQNIAAASRLIREAVESGRVLPHDAEAAPKLMRYIPFWAKSQAGAGQAPAR